MTASNSLRLRQRDFPYGGVRAGANGVVVQPASDLLPIAAVFRFLGLWLRGERNDFRVGHSPMLPHDKADLKQLLGIT